MKTLKVLLLCAAGLAFGVTAASAQDKFPSKPIKVEVPFGAGSATDIVIRIVGEQMRHELEIRKRHISSLSAPRYALYRHAAFDDPNAKKRQVSPYDF